MKSQKSTATFSAKSTQWFLRYDCFREQFFSFSAIFQEKLDRFGWKLVWDHGLGMRWCIGHISATVILWSRIPVSRPVSRGNLVRFPDSRGNWNSRKIYTSNETRLRLVNWRFLVALCDTGTGQYLSQHLFWPVDWQGPKLVQRQEVMVKFKIVWQR